MRIAMKSAAGIAVPGLLLTLAIVSFAASADLWPASVTANLSPPTLVAVPAHASRYRAAGQYLLKGVPVDAPLVEEPAARPLTIMQFEVSQSDYARCVSDGECRAAADNAKSSGKWPVTGVSFVDASHYAAWLSRQTGEFWRLPTDDEWAFAAGSRFADDGLGLAANAADPSQRWRATYAFENRYGGAAITAVQPQGHFGPNEFGLLDLAGTVWEWTTSCYDRVAVNADGTTASTTQNCGVRVLEGQHRTYLTAFIRDAKGGGCAVGKPPDHLGFRLVRETSPVPLLERFKSWWFSR